MSALTAAPAAGPLRVHPQNPRYFTDGAKNADGSLKAVYLTGSHTWNNLVDMDKADPPAPFDFPAYLDFLQRDGNVLEVHSLASPAITALQAAYIHKVVDTVNDLDNVLYEVINEGGNQQWDWWVVKTVKDYERTKPKQHPVGITGHGGERLATMATSPADWISPGSQDGFRDPPPAWDGRKVSLLDTDHVWGVGGTHAWVCAASCVGTIPFSWTCMTAPFWGIASIRNSSCSVAIWAMRCVTRGG